MRAAVRISDEGDAGRFSSDLRRDRGNHRLRSAAQRQARRMVGRRHPRASARSGPGHPPGRIRLTENSRRHQGSLPETVNIASSAMIGEPTHLTVMVFPGTQTLPMFAAQARGYFSKHDLVVVLKPAPNSEEQRAGLAAGRYQIVRGAACQWVALVEAAKVDAMIVAGGDNGFNHLFVQPEIARIADLRGRTLVADVANTGWSFVLYDILKRHGLSRGDIAIHEAGAPFRRFGG